MGGKLLVALLTGFGIVLFLTTICGIVIDALYTFVLQTAFWFNTESRFIIFILALIALLLSTFIFAVLMDAEKKR